MGLPDVPGTGDRDSRCIHDVCCGIEALRTTAARNAMTTRTRELLAQLREFSHQFIYRNLANGGAVVGNHGLHCIAKFGEFGG